MQLIACNKTFVNDCRAGLYSFSLLPLYTLLLLVLLLFVERLRFRFILQRNQLSLVISRCNSRTHTKQLPQRALHIPEQTNRHTIQLIVNGLANGIMTGSFGGYNEYSRWFIRKGNPPGSPLQQNISPDGREWSQSQANFRWWAYNKRWFILVSFIDGIPHQTSTDIDRCL